jgi:hypothetical protein
MQKKATVPLTRRKAEGVADLLSDQAADQSQDAALDLPVLLKMVERARAEGALLDLENLPTSTHWPTIIFGALNTASRTGPCPRSLGCR